ncbi:protein transport protein SEC61 subunit beta, putative [Plasmodium vivax]|uniref:Protein transport protein Sec61 subunit beta n=6 Tax=Plasmodium vivax TaxID=5855 RepID=A5K5N2_PLAVS|nr:protein transport protein sec61 beta 1 subunit, putative [Plasmodium vivax]KMZ81803.1 protein transporter sec61 beta 1 subunit [Plasmodium vivax India VII]KMZ88087.1 protein transporter sec61 beta 1 subunit [Plasmodium vivax Brazil I]KMZ94465.1 protein transporter sec61 beta 1 subunit [Plasmodium vivax Mauritania I]KNA01182.1 protein transporter sec61 beta 1 subunit [Plasmodium vivax North Korean]EDL45217.1 protein transport protein sec61 beta 1 subunit, putative [Plasmodium vivax]|eukprot:XP_001614944.1 protein transport protein sec61 beta 1 subunit [Plasmodium vivax Sal-1]
MNSSPVIVGGMRTPARRRQSTASASSNSKPRGSNSGNTNSIVKFYGDDSPGFKLTPQTVLISTLIFMATVVILHIISKI